MDGTPKRESGYSTDLETSKSIDWLERRDKNKPFLLMCEFKAPHRTFCPPIKYPGAFDGVEIPDPPTLFDDHAARIPALAANEMSIDGFMEWGYDLKVSKEERGELKLKPEDMEDGAT